MKLNQRQKVLRHLKEVGSINPLMALKEYSIMRLAAVVYDLKDEGYVSFAKYTCHLTFYWICILIID